MTRKFVKRTLDAERAFDGVPTCVLLYKTMKVVTDSWWRLMYAWYLDSKAMIKYMGKLSSPFNIQKGTRQGGLTSPFLFNVLYQDMIHDLSQSKNGLMIGNNTYSVFCYADDILLMSMTATGLQRLIDTANDYICAHGLSFNAAKSSCTVFGNHSFVYEPRWCLNGLTIQNMDEINYLGAILCYDSKRHRNLRATRCRRAFYSLQSAGLCQDGVKPKIKSYLWKAALQPILTYGNDCIGLSKADFNELDKVQAKLIKASLGLSKYMRTTPLLQALAVDSVSKLADINCMKLFRSIMFNSSRSANFYTYMLSRSKNHNVLSNRVYNICDSMNFNFTKYLIDEDYVKQCTNVMRAYQSEFQSGLVDSCKMLLHNYTPADKRLLVLLIMPRF